MDLVSLTVAGARATVLVNPEHVVYVAEYNQRATVYLNGVDHEGHGIIINCQDTADTVARALTGPPLRR